MWTWDIVHEARGVKGSGWSDADSEEFLKKISVKILAFSTDCVKVCPSFIKCGIDDIAVFFEVLTNDQKFLLPLL